MSWVLLVTSSVILVTLIGEMIVTLSTLAFTQIVVNVMEISLASTTPSDSSPFQVYWNIPSFMCHRYNIPIRNATQQFAIKQNFNDEFRGNELVILYDPGKFPAILHNSSAKKFFLRNHGIPQEGNLFAHLEIFEQHVKELIPDRNFSGLAIIDFESWRPIYRQNFGTLQPYKDLSLHVERQRHPRWPERRLEKEATKRFENAARRFMEETLWLAQKLRPEASWGYYAFPYCFNWRAGDFVEGCPTNVKQENNRIQWLFDSSDVLFPSVYMTEKIDPVYRIPMVRGRVAEAIRLSGQVREEPRPRIFVYHRYVYTDTLQYISEMDTYGIFHTIKQSGANGIVLWGSSNDLNTKDKCLEFYNYLLNTLGPVINSLQPEYYVKSAVQVNNDA